MITYNYAIIVHTYYVAMGKTADCNTYVAPTRHSELNTDSLLTPFFIIGI